MLPEKRKPYSPMPCPTCKEICPSWAAAQEHCVDKFIYVKLRKTDLSRLIQFIYLKNDEILTKSLLEDLLKFNRLIGETKKTYE